LNLSPSLATHGYRGRLRPPHPACDRRQPPVHPRADPKDPPGSSPTGRVAFCGAQGAATRLLAFTATICIDGRNDNPAARSLTNPACGTPRRTSMHIAKTLASLAFAAVLSAGVAHAQTEIKFGHVGKPGSLLEMAAQEFAKRANVKLGNKAKVVVYGSSQLGGDSEMMKKLKLGTIDLVQPSTVMSSYVPSFGLFEMPYLVKDRGHMARIRDQIVFPTMVPQAEKAGYHIIALWENGFRQITNNKRPIVKPEDLQGIKLRVPKGVWRVKMFKAYGANPTPLGFSEVFVALQTGAMDGQENPLAQIVSGHFQEVQKYLSMTGHVYTPTYVVAGASWKRMPADVQNILSDTAKEMQPVALKMAADLDAKLLEQIKKTPGIKINEADKDAFIKASKAIYEEFGKEVPGGQELIDKALALGHSS
jgi:tripartite ATP-independent transporter DctP family solute receptor